MNSEKEKQYMSTGYGDPCQKERRNVAPPTPLGHSQMGDDLQKALLDFEKTLRHVSLPRRPSRKGVVYAPENENIDWSDVGLVPQNDVSHENGNSPHTLPRSHIKNHRYGVNWAPVQEMALTNTSTNNASAETLQIIREQMAASLRRMRELEDQIRVIPGLNDQIGKLKKENEMLKKELETKKEAIITPTPLSSLDKMTTSHDLVHSRAIAVGCSVLPRDVGVSTNIILTRSIAAGPDPKTRLNEIETVSLEKIIGTSDTFKYKNASVLTDGNNAPIGLVNVIKCKNAAIMTDRDHTLSFEIQEKLSSMHPSHHINKLEQRSVAIVTDLKYDDIATISETNKIVEDIIFKLRPLPKTTVSVNTDLRQDQIFTQDELDVHAAKLAKTFENNRLINKSHNAIGVNVCIQPDGRPMGVQTTITRVVDVGIVAKPKTISLAQQVEVKTIEMSTNTPKMKFVSTAVETDQMTSKDQPFHQFQQSIPQKIQLSRPTHLSLQTHLPVPVNKVKPSLTPSPLLNPGLQHEGSNSDSGSDDGTYTIHQDIGHGFDGPRGLLDQSPKPQEYTRREPSREMKGAMKVLNDALQKSSSGDIPKHVKTAVNIVQQEWFKVSSVATANPLDVEYYLDCFEEISCILLEYVVNMTDVSGNTAMHYAVSSGNFDVVSILLDSKVCNINKLNTAGYTCIMLVALTKVKSETDREVVRRLIQMADVNIRAKKHGQTALMLAVSHGLLDTVELLLEAGAEINIQDEDGSTALMCAAEHGYIEIVKLLLAQPDCDLSIMDYDGTTALAIAMEAGNRDIGVLLYAQEHFSRGSSLKHKRSKSATPTLKSSRPSTPSQSVHKRDYEVES